MSTNTDWRKEPGVLVCCYCGRAASTELEPKTWDWAYVVCPRKPCEDLLRANAPFKFEPVAVVVRTHENARFVASRRLRKGGGG